ncbi:hypothetical protein SAMN05216303_101523 [Rhodoferax sp. OV413]|nr:hypothetical protein SAMN05216303_101523 [Rhodoferax sp. OV413]
MTQAADFNSRSWSGSAPDRAVTFLCAAKEKSPKERLPPLTATLRCAAGNLRCALLTGERSNSLRSDNRAPDPAKSTQRRRSKRGTQDAGADSQPGIAGHRALGAMGRTAPPIPGVPLCMRRGAQLQVDQGWRCLSAASLARPHLQRAPQVSLRYAQGRRQWGRPFFWLLFFGHAKKSDCAAGRTSRPRMAIDHTNRSAE